MNIAIVGAGSIGGLFAAKLSNAGVQNLLVHSRGTMGEAFISTGIRVSGLSTLNIPVSNYFPSMAEVGIPPKWKQAADLIIITGKSTHAEELIETAYVLSHSKSIVFSPSNGIGWEELLCKKFGKSRVLAASTTHAAKREGNSSISYTGIGEIVLGAIGGNISEDTVQEIIDLLSMSSLKPRWVDDGESVVWEKAILNAAINPLAALSGVKNGELLKGNNWFTALEIMYEACLVARTHGVLIRQDEEMEELLSHVLESTAQNTCSMGQDLMYGRKTEIDFINGKIVELAETYGIPVPFNRLLTTLVKMSEPNKD